MGAHWGTFTLLLLAACAGDRDDAVGTTGAGAGGSVATSGGGGTAEGGGGDAACGPACIDCCNDPACPTTPPTGSPDGCVANLSCFYEEAGCVAHHLCGPGGGGFAKLTTPADCPGTCASPWAEAPCLDPGKQCTAPGPIKGVEECVYFTCTAAHRFDEGVTEPGPCPE